MWSWEYSRHILPGLLDGLLLTVELTASAAALAVVLAIPLAAASRSRLRVVRYLTRLVLEFVRGTPVLVQLFFVFYVLPDFGILLSPFLTGVLVLGVHNAMYVSEVYRANIEAIPAGQWEAARALHLGPGRTWRKIVLPPAMRASIPAVTAYIIGMYKQTALLFTIGLGVLLERAQADANFSYRFLEPYTIAGILYLLVSYMAAIGLRRLERRYV